MIRVLVPLAPGCEEMEAVIVIDVLRRAGIVVVAAGTAEGPIVASRGVRLLPDVSLDDALSAGDYAAVVLPGGAPGARALAEDPRILRLLAAFANDGKIIGAICAAPTVLLRAGLLAGRRVTAHPAVHAELRAEGIEVRASERVVIDGPFFTSQSPGTAFEFAYALVEALVGREKVEELEAGILSRLR